MRLLVLTSLLAVSAVAQVNECAELASECREDCSIEHSSIKGDAPKKLNRCLKKCQKKFTTCEERELETKNNALEAGSLDKSPVSTDVDEQGLPTRTAVKKAKSTDDEERRPSPGDDLRDDRPAPAEEAPKKSSKSAKAAEREPPPPREEVRESEVPRSSRTQLKVDEKEAAKETKKAEAPPARRPEPEPVAASSKPEPKPEPKRVEEDLRDDKPRAEPPPPPPKAKSRPDEPPPPKPKPKEEDHDDLRNY